MLVARNNISIIIKSNFSLYQLIHNLLRLYHHSIYNVTRKQNIKFVYENESHSKVHASNLIKDIISLWLILILFIIIHGFDIVGWVYTLRMFIPASLKYLYHHHGIIIIVLAHHTFKLLYDYCLVLWFSDRLYYRTVASQTLGNIS